MRIKLSSEYGYPIEFPLAYFDGYIDYYGCGAGYGDGCDFYGYGNGNEDDYVCRELSGCLDGDGFGDLHDMEYLDGSGDGDGNGYGYGHAFGKGYLFGCKGYCE